jgi:hypothetical protein
LLIFLSPGFRNTQMFLEPEFPLRLLRA